jgi:hypothetical protein
MYHIGLFVILKKTVLRIRFRTICVLGLLDPDPVVRGTDPALCNQAKIKLQQKNIVHTIETSLFFIFENYGNVAFKLRYRMS